MGQEILKILCWKEREKKEGDDEIKWKLLINLISNFLIT